MTRSAKRYSKGRALLFFRERKVGKRKQHQKNNWKFSPAFFKRRNGSNAVGRWSPVATGETPNRSSAPERVNFCLRSKRKEGKPQVGFSLLFFRERKAGKRKQHKKGTSDSPFLLYGFCFLSSLPPRGRWFCRRQRRKGPANKMSLVQILSLRGLPQSRSATAPSRREPILKRTNGRTLPKPSPEGEGGPLAVDEELVWF